MGALSTAHDSKREEARVSVPPSPGPRASAESSSPLVREEASKRMHLAPYAVLCYYEVRLPKLRPFPLDVEVGARVCACSCRSFTLVHAPLWKALEVL